MLNKSLLLGRISFPLIPEVVKEYNMKNKCLEIRILLPSFPPVKSYSTVKAWLKCWEVFWVLVPSDPDPFLWALTTARISLADRFCLILELCECLGLASHLSNGSMGAWTESYAALCPSQQTFVHRRCSCNGSYNQQIIYSSVKKEIYV